MGWCANKSVKIRWLSDSGLGVRWELQREGWVQRGITGLVWISWFDLPVVVHMKISSGQNRQIWIPWFWICWSFVPGLLVWPWAGHINFIPQSNRVGDVKLVLFLAKNTVRENVLACSMPTDTVLRHQVAHGLEDSLTNCLELLRAKKKSLSHIYPYHRRSYSWSWA